MDEEIARLDVSSVTTTEDMWAIEYRVSDPVKHIVFVPGGLVEPDSYSFLALSLALEGYSVTVVKPAFNLAILMPNQAARYLSDAYDNIIIGHSLGGVVASMVASKHDNISSVILLGSYPIKDISSKDVLLITAEFDLGMDEDKFNDHLSFVSDDVVIVDIEGGNHAQFGWYGPQKGDGEAEISTLVQQRLVIETILQFIQ